MNTCNKVAAFHHPSGMNTRMKKPNNSYTT